MLKNLKALREEMNITQKQLADKIGVSQQSINKYENHSVEPDIHTMIRMADFFDTTVDYLIGRSERRCRIDILNPYELNEEERRVIEGFRQLSVKQKWCVGMVIDAFEVQQ